MSRSDQLIQTLNAKQPRRVVVYMEVQVAGKWVWELFTVGQVLADSPATGPTPTARLSDRPVLQAPPRAAAPQSVRPPAPAMTMGRDPGKHLITFGKFFRENGNRAIPIEQLDMTELFDWHGAMKDAENPSPQLEVSLEMIEAYLVEREFVPAPKYKTSRRNA